MATFETMLIGTTLYTYKKDGFEGKLTDCYHVTRRNVWRWFERDKSLELELFLLFSYPLSIFTLK